MGGNSKFDRKFQALLDEYGHLLRHAIRRTCPPHLGLSPEDIEQDARLRLWRALQSEREIVRPASFLYRVAVTATVDAIRRAKNRREVPLEPEQQKSAAEVGLYATANRANPEETADRRGLLATVLGRLHRLAPDRRRAVALYLQGFTTTETAELLDWTEPRARNLTYRGLEELRRTLRAEGIEYEAE